MRKIISYSNYIKESSDGATPMDDLYNQKEEIDKKYYKDLTDLKVKFNEIVSDCMYDLTDNNELYKKIEKDQLDTYFITYLFVVDEGCLDLFKRELINSLSKIKNQLGVKCTLHSPLMGSVRQIGYESIVSYIEKFKFPGSRSSSSFTLYIGKSGE